MAERHSDEMSIFLSAIEIDSVDKRNAYLDTACGEDPNLRAAVVALLREHETAQGLLDSPDIHAPTLDFVPIAEKPGMKIGRYKLIHEIGHGGMGVVFMAVQKEPVRRKVALKIIKPGMDTKEVVSRFEAERQALALMDHPSIAHVLDGGSTESGRPYFVMELVEGTPITEYADACRYTTRQRLELFIQVCQAVQHAHLKGIIHRDIKPSNVLVTTRDTVAVPKVIDFGIAKAVHQSLTDASVYTQVSQMIGTPLYMSPEQAQRTAEDVDTRTDVYSLGVLLYELLTGTTPFDKARFKESGLDEVKRIIREEEPPKPSTRLSTVNAALETLTETHGTNLRTLTRELSGELDWIVMKAMEKDRTRRYESASDFAKDVQRYLDDEPVEACPPSTVYLLRKTVRRHKTAIAFATTVASLLVLGLAGTSWQAFRAGRAERQTLSGLDDVRKQRDEARVARQKTEAVLGFLVESLRSPDPERDGQTITVAELLDRAVGSFDVAFQDEPLTRAELAQAIGETYLGLGLFEKAIPVVRLALSIRQTELGPNHEDTLKSMVQLGRSYMERMQYDKASAIYSEILAKQKMILGLDHHDTLVSMGRLGRAFVLDGQIDKGLSLLQETLRKKRAILGADHPTTIVSIGDLAAAFRHAGQYDRALPLYEDALTQQMALSGPNSLDSNKCAGNLGSAYVEAKQFGKGLPLLEKAFEAKKAILGEEHPAILMDMTGLSVAYDEAGLLDHAIPLLARALKMDISILGMEHPITLTTMQRLATTYRQVNRLNDALDLQQRSLEGMKAAFGVNHPETFLAMVALARTYLQLKQPDKAIPLFQQAVAGRTALLGADNPITLSAMYGMAEALLLSGQPEEARSLHEQVLELRMKRLGPEHLDTAISAHRIAQLLYAAGESERALLLCEHAIDVFAKTSGPNARRTLAAMNNLGMFCIDAAQYDRALATLKAVLEIKRTTLPPRDPSTIISVSNLALAYSKAEKYQEAADLYREVVEAKRKLEPPNPASLASTLAALATCLLKLGKFEEAESYARESVTIRQTEMPDNWFLFNSQSLLGASLAGQQKYGEAEQLLIEAYQGIKAREDQLPAKLTFRMTEALQRIIDLYDAWEKPEQAAQWREKLSPEAEITDGD